MSSLNRDLIFLIMQLLGEEKFEEAVHMLEQESGLFFNMKYFEDQVLDGNWDNIEQYLSGFTKINANKYSGNLFFRIRKQKFFQAVDKRDRAKALDILVNDMKVFFPDEESFNKAVKCVSTSWENTKPSECSDTKAARTLLLVVLNMLIKLNPLLYDKLQFPSLESSRLHTLISQSLKFQHKLCKNPRPSPDIKTLFVDHTCAQQNGACMCPSPANNPLLESIQKAGDFPPLTYPPLRPASTTVPTPLANGMSKPSAVIHPTGFRSAIGLSVPTNPVSFLKHPRTTPSTNPAVDYSSADFDHVSKRTRPMSISEEVNLPINISPATYSQNHSPATYTPEDLPRSVARTLTQGSAPLSMDFHPIKQTILLVGTIVGDIGLWDVGSRERLVLKNFKVWELGACSMALQTALVKDPGVSVNRIMWSPDGSMFGVAYSRHIVQIYSYHGSDDIRQHLEIDAHVGGVNDLAFAQPNKQLCVISCGDDKTIKVWDATSGSRQFTFEGHEAPVYSVLPHDKVNIQLIFSAALDGKIKAWLYENRGPVIDYDAPGQYCTALSYTADGTRLFSCIISEGGESYIVEWNESDGYPHRTYQVLCHNKQYLNVVVQFDITRSRFLAVGDECLVKFWDIDNHHLLTTTDADGGLPARPRIRFNKEGTLLAVSTHNNGIKILANSYGLHLLRTFEKRSFDISRTLSETVTKPLITPVPNASIATSSGMIVRASPTVSASNGDARNLTDPKPRLTDKLMDKSKIWKLTEISEPAQCRTLRLMYSLITSKISRLIYTNSGVAILALASNGIHLLWKLPHNDCNPGGKATASVTPQLWLPQSGILMTNEKTVTNPEEAVPCFALSKNDAYVISASGGEISLFNMVTFKTMATFMPPPPAATFLAFHPQDNNIIAIGMDDSTIQIYDVQFDEVKSKLRGHSKRITCLTFSHELNVLVSSGADSQICVWGIDGWEKQRSKYLQIPSGRTHADISDTRIQFHRDHIHLLAVHETQIAIYETTKLECVKQWVPLEGSASISHATFSCDSKLIYVSFLDAAVCIFFAANLRPQCRINPSAYLPSNVSSRVHPLAIAAHPLEPDQFALALTDGLICVLEPLESEAKWWGVVPPSENGSMSSNSLIFPVEGSALVQPQR